MSSAFENAMSDEQANNYTQQYPVTCEHGNYQLCYWCEHAEANHWKATAELMVQNASESESRAAQLEAERDAVLERERIELIEWAARSNEQFALRQQTQLELDTARAAIGRYQDERVMLLSRIEALVAELQEQEARDNPYILHGEELKRATEARIAGRP